MDDRHKPKTEVQVVESAAGFTVQAGYYESKMEAERIASMLRFTIKEERTDSRDLLNEAGWDY